jgi:hypothetical protein
MKTFNNFEVLGYDVDHFIDGKYIGSITLQEPDRKDYGYQGRQYHTADQVIILKKNGGKVAKIKPGQKFYTELQVVCGKRIEC